MQINPAAPREVHLYGEQYQRVEKNKSKAGHGQQAQKETNEAGWQRQPLLGGGSQPR
jgi:hypothetical protein